MPVNSVGGGRIGPRIHHGSSMKAVIVSAGDIPLIRPAIVETIRHALYSMDEDAFYRITGIVDAFDISPREVGFNFPNWEAYTAARSAVRYPNYFTEPCCDAGSDEEGS